MYRLEAPKREAKPVMTKTLSPEAELGVLRSVGSSFAFPPDADPSRFAAPETGTKQEPGRPPKRE